MERQGPPNDLSLNPDSGALHVSDSQRVNPQSSENSTPFGEESLKTYSESSFEQNSVIAEAKRMSEAQKAGEDISTLFDKKSINTYSSDSSFVPNSVIVEARRMDVGQQTGEDTNNSSGANELRDQTNNQD